MSTNLNTPSSQPSFWGKYNLLCHALIMLIIMFAIGTLQPTGSITPIGMKLLGIFAAALYGWTACGLFWPSLLAIVAMTFSGLYDSLAQFLPSSFGSETMVFVLFLFAFTEVINEVGLVDYIANKMISFKILNNRPWIFTFVFLLAAYICAAFINIFAALFVFWSMTYIVVRRFGFQPYDKYPTLLIMGVTLASIIGGCVMPYKPVPLIALGAYSQVSGQAIDYLQYIMFSLPMTLLVMLFFVLICRFVFRPDLKELKHINIDFVDKNALILNTKQKTAALFLILFILLMLAPSILPKTWALAIIIKKLGIAGCLFILIILMTLIRFDGQPLLDFKQMAAKGINWDIFLAFCFIIPFTSAFTSDVTGIKPFILECLQPLLSSLSPMGFIIAAMIIATILTNFANNMVITTIFATLIFTIGADLGLEIMPLIAILIICANLSIATPAACPQAAMMFGNKEWCRTKDLYTYSLIFIVIAFVLTLSMGIIWANIIF